jgi:prepilin signal peptidase PulO-like enzyme (type II secretory pathway)
MLACLSPKFEPNPIKAIFAEFTCDYNVALMVLAYPNLYLAISAAIISLAFASFTGLIIDRKCRGISIIKPGSHCPKCQTPLRWFQNIPLFSFIFLQGRCAYCKTKISIENICIEILYLLVSLPIIYRFFLSASLDEALISRNILMFLFFIVLTTITIAIGFIDFKTFQIPHALSYSGIIIALVCVYLFQGESQLISSIQTMGFILLFYDKILSVNQSLLWNKVLFITSIELEASHINPIWNYFKTNRVLLEKRYNLLISFHQSNNFQNDLKMLAAIVRNADENIIADDNNGATGQ